MYEAREQEREARRLQASLSLGRGPGSNGPSLERFRTSSKYQDRPAAADIAFYVAAYVNGLNNDIIERALEDDSLSPIECFQASSLHTADDDEGERLSRALRIVAPRT